MNTTTDINTKTNKGKNFVGTVTSVSMAKTVLVEVTHMKKHPLYKKSLKRTRKFASHNEIPDIQIGDKVEISQMRPMSKTKHFKVVKKI